MKKYTISAALAVGLLAGCGAGSDPAPAKSADPSSEGPSCTGIWVTGKTLPADYRQCRDDKGREVGPVVECTSRAGGLANWDRWWAYTGDEIHEFGAKYLDDPDGSPEFKASFDDCLS